MGWTKGTLILLTPLAVILAASPAKIERSQDSWPMTRAERTHYTETSHYEDVIAFLDALKAHGAPIRIEFIGKSFEGRPIPLVIASRTPGMTPELARQTGKPVIYIQANIHAGEVEGKEAALAILRRACQAKAGGLLDRAVILMTPIYNIDGNEKFGPVERNRPEQDGPAMVGVRPNGQNFDLNRDCIKAESPEMRGVLEHVYKRWNPDVILDLHTTDGTRHGYELTYAPPLNPNTDPAVMRFTRDEMLPTVRRQFRQKYGVDLFDYGNAESGGGEKAWYTFEEKGRYVTNYAGLRNRIAVLSEATTYIPFKARVEATDRFVSLVLDYVLRNSARVVRITHQADRRVTGWGQNPNSAPKLGVRFDFGLRGTEEVSLEKPPPAGLPAPLGRPKELVGVKMPIFDRFKTVKTADFPAAYLIPPDQTATVDLLRRHGIAVAQLPTSWHGKVEEFRITKMTVADRPFQGHKLVTLDGSFSTRMAAAEKGWYLVRTAQPLGVLAFTILEPESLDGAAAWCFLGDSLKEGSAYPIWKACGTPSVPTAGARGGPGLGCR